MSGDSSYTSYAKFNMNGKLIADTYKSYIEINVTANTAYATGTITNNGARMFYFIPS